MPRTKAHESLANQIHLAVYGESIDERLLREREKLELERKKEREKLELERKKERKKLEQDSIIEKTIIVQNLLSLPQLTMEQISKAVGESLDFVKKVKEKMNP